VWPLGPRATAADGVCSACHREREEGQSGEGEGRPEWRGTRRGWPEWRRRGREREGRVEKEIEAMWLGLGEVVVRSMGKGGIKDRERGVKKP